MTDDSMSEYRRTVITLKANLQAARDALDATIKERDEQQRLLAKYCELYEQALQERDAVKEENTVLHKTCGHYEEEILRLRTDLAALFVAKSEAQPPSAAPPDH